MKSHVRVQFSSHSWMKSITSPIIFGSSFIIWRSSPKLGTFLSLSSWPARICILSARLFIASWDSSWVLRCCQIYQLHYSCRKQRRSSPGMRYQYNKTQFSLQNSTCSSQIAGMWCFSRMIYLADSLSDFNNHFHAIAYGTKTIQNGLELDQVLDCDLEPNIQCGQGRTKGLWLNFE